MVMSAYEFETKEKQKLTKIKNYLQHIHVSIIVMYRCSEIYSPNPGKGCQTTGKLAQSNGRKVRQEDNLT